MDTQKQKLVAKFIGALILGAIIVLAFTSLSGFASPDSKEISELAEKYKTQFIFRQQALIERDRAEAIVNEADRQMNQINKRLEEIRAAGFIIPEEIQVLKKS